MSEPKQAKRYFVSGNVQGVGFRFFTLRAAERMNLTGYARNLPDGRVELVAEGEDLKTLTINEVLPNSPAAEAGLQEEDELIAINGRPVFTFKAAVGTKG